MRRASGIGDSRTRKRQAARGDMDPVLDRMRPPPLERVQQCAPMAERQRCACPRLMSSRRTEMSPSIMVFGSAAAERSAEQPNGAGGFLCHCLLPSSQAEFPSRSGWAPSARPVRPPDSPSPPAGPGSFSSVAPHAAPKGRGRASRRAAGVRSAVRSPVGLPPRRDRRMTKQCRRIPRVRCGRFGAHSSPADAGSRNSPRD